MKQIGYIDTLYFDIKRIKSIEYSSVKTYTIQNSETKNICIKLIEDKFVFSVLYNLSQLFKHKIKMKHKIKHGRNLFHHFSCTQL